VKRKRKVARTGRERRRERKKREGKGKREKESAMERVSGRRRGREGGRKIA